MTKDHHGVYSVMMGEPRCCNPNDANATTNKQCKKYCMGKSLKKIMDRINPAKSSGCRPECVFLGLKSLLVRIRR